MSRLLVLGQLRLLFFDAVARLFGELSDFVLGLAEFEGEAGPLDTRTGVADGLALLRRRSFSRVGPVERLVRGVARASASDQAARHLAEALVLAGLHRVREAYIAGDP